MRRLALASFGILLGASTASPAHADPLLVPFDVVVGAAHGDMRPFFGVAIHAGDVLRGTLTYDRDTIGHNPVAGFQSFIPIDGSIAIHAGSGFSLPLEVVDVFDVPSTEPEYYRDTVAAFATSYSVPGFEWVQMELDFQGAPWSRHTADLPRSAAEIAAFATVNSFRFAGNQVGSNPPFDLTSHEFLGPVRLAETPAATPEPASGLLLAGGLAALLRRRKRPSAG
jgi:hypothetical protein